MNMKEVYKKLHKAERLVAEVEIAYGHNQVDCVNKNDNQLLSKMIHIENLIIQVLSDMEKI